MPETRPVTQPAVISTTIRRLRRERGLTQEALAQAVGVTPQAISKWETGQTMPDITLLLSLSKELGIGVDELLGGNRRQELMDRFMQAAPYGEELILLVCEEALEEFPDDEFFLYQRACAQLYIAEKTYVHREQFIQRAIQELYILTSRYPDDPIYCSKLAHAYMMLGDRGQAHSVMLKYTGPNKEMWMEPFLDEETRAEKKQKTIQKCVHDLYSALRDYETKESLAAAHVLLDSLMGEEKRLCEPSLWILSVREAILCRDAGDDGGFATHLTKAYEQARAVDALPLEVIPYQNPLFDRLLCDRSMNVEIISQTFQFINAYHNLFAHPAAIGLKRRILDEMVRCRRLERCDSLNFLQFCGSHINTANSYNYSTCWDMSDQETVALAKEFTQSPYFNKYRSVVHQNLTHNKAEQMCRDGILQGYIAKYYSSFIAFCNCKEKSEYTYLAVPADCCANTAPEGARVLAIAEMLISHDFYDCGLEEKLLEYVLTDAKKQGYTHVEAYPLQNCTPEMFEKHIACYKRMGFAVIRELPIERRIPGEEEPRIIHRCIMQKEL